MGTIAEILESKRRQLADSLASRGFSQGGIPIPQFDSAQRFLLLSILIGVFSGLLVVCFHFLIEFVSWGTLGVPVGESFVFTLLFPPFGAFISVLLIREVFPRAEGSGINNTKAAIYISDGYIPLQSVLGKFLACSISIGSGNSLGPEDPALQMGAGVASYIGRSFRLAKEHMRLIAPVGAAAGIAAAFNTPITAVLFVIEEVIGSWNAGVLGSIVLSSVSAVVVTRSFLGDQPLFRVPEFQFRDPVELLAYAVMGVAGGLVSVAFARILVLIRERFRDLGPGGTTRCPRSPASRWDASVWDCRESWAPDTKPSIAPCTTSSAGDFCCCSVSRSSSRRCSASAPVLPVGCSRPLCSWVRCSAAVLDC